MQATTLGKLLVLLNTILSLTLAGVAFGIYTNRIDWAAASPANQRNLATYPAKKSEFESSQKAATLGVNRWEEATGELAALEKVRPINQAIYTRNLNALDHGPNPVRDIIRQAKTGVPILGPDGLPTLRPSKPPLLCRDDYNKEILRVEADIASTIQMTRQVIDDEQKRTEEINGIPGQPQKGLRDLLSEEVLVKKNAVRELEYLRPLRYNFQVESVLLEKRKRSLEERLQELNRLGMAISRP
jgi:hypothetical protein